MKRLVSIIVALALITALSACSNYGGKYCIFFASADGKSFAEEYVEIDEFGSVENKARLIIEKMLEGPVKSEHKRVIPKETALIGVHLEEKTATVNFTQEFENTPDDGTRLLAIYSVVNTLCSIDGINKVHILVNGRGIRYMSNDTEIGPISMSKVIMADVIGKNKAVIIELYFANDEKTALVSEKRTVDIKDNETVEKTAIMELFKGPESGGKTLLTKDIKVLSVEIKDGICYVNLSKELFDVPTETSKLCIYSIVNTLTGLQNTAAVQFLVEGVKQERLGDTVLSEPFMYNAFLVD